MKNRYIALLCLALSCKPSTKEQITQDCREQTANLTQEIAQRDTLIDNLIGFYAEMEQNLAHLTQKKQEIFGYTHLREKGKKQDLSDRLRGDLMQIATLQKESQEKISLLKSKLQNRTGQMSQIENTIQGLQNRMMMQQEEIAGLKKELWGVSQEYVSIFDEFLKTTQDTSIINE
jgi:hypothetical protein